MATYLVTGAAGFIASKVCEFLLADGHTVVGIDNLNDYYDVRLKDYRLSRLLGINDWQPGHDSKASTFISPASYPDLRSPNSDLRSERFTFRYLDIENLPALDAIFAEFRFYAVFNLAARAGVRYSMENPHVYLSTNTQGTLNILECMRKYGVPKHVLASTSSLYAGCPMPFSEDLPVNTPLSPYAATKKGAELLAFSYFKLYGLDTTVLRYFTVFGPAGRPDMSIFRFIKWIDQGEPIELFGDGSQSRDFTYVDDIARGTILAGRLFGGRILGSNAGLEFPSSGSAPAGYEVINLGGGNRPITISTMIGMIEDHLDRRAIIERHPQSPADMKETWADITKAGQLLGWRPQVSPEEGFRLAVEWYSTNRDWLRKLVV